jgi:hypothetical protein
MPESPAFEWTAEALEAATDLSRIEARGTIRLVLKEAGLEPGSVNEQQMHVVLTRVLPPALERRRVDEPEALCKRLASRLALESLGSSTRESAHDVFARFGRKGSK